MVRLSLYYSLSRFCTLTFHSSSSFDPTVSLSFMLLVLPEFFVFRLLQWFYKRKHWQQLEDLGPVDCQEHGHLPVWSSVFLLLFCWFSSGCRPPSFEDEKKEANWTCLLNDLTVRLSLYCEHNFHMLKFSMSSFNVILVAILGAHLHRSDNNVHHSEASGCKLVSRSMTRSSSPCDPQSNPRVESSRFSLHDPR